MKGFLPLIVSMLFVSINFTLKKAVVRFFGRCGLIVLCNIRA